MFDWFWRSIDDLLAPSAFLGILLAVVSLGFAHVPATVRGYAILKRSVGWLALVALFDLLALSFYMGVKLVSTVVAFVQQVRGAPMTSPIDYKVGFGSIIALVVAVVATFLCIGACRREARGRESEGVR